MKLKCKIVFRLSAAELLISSMEHTDPLMSITPISHACQTFHLQVTPPKMITKYKNAQSMITTYQLLEKKEKK